MPPSDEHRVASLLSGLAPRLNTLATPLLVFDLDAVDHNIGAMAAYAGPDRWRPHVKTHKHPSVIRAAVAQGVSAFKCATLDELAMILSASDAVDVLLAYPLPPSGMQAAARLAALHPRSTIRVLLDSPEHLAQVDAAMGGAPSRLSAFLDVDVGMGRTGTPPSRWGTPSAVNLDLVGLHGYEGHLTWKDADAASNGYRQLVALAEAVPFDVQWVVTSGTHAFHHALAHAGLREGPWQHQVSPGTLVLSDLRSAEAAELLGLHQAAFVLSRVISRPAPGRITLDAGSKALNPDCPPPGCRIVGHPDVAAQQASEEHRPCITDADALRPGELVALIPEHVCTTVNMYRSVQLVRGDRDLGLAELSASSRTHELGAFGSK